MNPTKPATLLKQLAIGCCMLFAVLLFTRQAVITYHDTIAYGGTDLRVRIVGSRLMAAGLNPFFTKWQPGMGDYLCDPNDTYGRPINGVTVTPFILWLQQPLSRYSYATIRVVWWVLQQCLFIFTVIVCACVYRHSARAMVAIILSAAALANHPSWILHCERGQLYILYAAWLVVLFALWRKATTRWAVATGAWLAVGILMRPTLIVFAVPAIVTFAWSRKYILFLTGAGTLLLLLVLSGTWDIWPTYFSAMQVYINSEIGGLTFPTGIAPVRPGIIEGTTNITRFRTDIRPNYFSSLNNYLAELSIWPPRKFFPIVLVLMNGLFIGFTYLVTRFRLQAAQTLMFGSLLYFITEVCQPFRAPYNLVVWLPTALVGIGFIVQYASGKYILRPSVP